MKTTSTMPRTHCLRICSTRDDPFVRLPMAGGYHEVAFVNLTTVDYISVPHHRFMKGHDEVLENEIEEDENREQKPKPVKRKRRS